MSAPGQLVLKLRTERTATREAVAAATGLTIERQEAIESAITLPTYHERRTYAKFFEFGSVQDFDEAWRGTTVRLSRGEMNGRIPVINLAPAGSPQDFEEQYVDSGIGHSYIDPPPGIVGPNLFAFVILGDSMAPDYPEGHFAICRPTPSDQIPDGHAVFVRFGASRDYTCTFKKCFRLDALRVELRPVNTRHATLIVDKEEINRMSPVIALLAPDRANQQGPRQSHRIIADDVQCQPDDGMDL
jgi:phage repressor protein C with HTH and peptisase S24 domain